MLPHCRLQRAVIEFELEEAGGALAVGGAMFAAVVAAVVAAVAVAVVVAVAVAAVAHDGDAPAVLGDACPLYADG